MMTTETEKIDLLPWQSVLTARCIGVPTSTKSSHRPYGKGLKLTKSLRARNKRGQG
jgi:hypothetical protein